MSETNPAAPSSTGAGAMLRAAREKQGLHIAALAAAIKVSPRKLDALEHDRWHELPDATFTRALAQTVCRTLKIDARPVLDKLPPSSATALQSQDAGLNEPFRDRPGREEPGFAVTAVRPMVWGAAALMVAAVAVYLLPADWWSRLATPAPVLAPLVAPVATPDPVTTSIPAAASASAAVVGIASGGTAASAVAAAITAPAAASAPALPASSTSTPVPVAVATVPLAPPPAPITPAVAPAPPVVAAATAAATAAVSALVQLRTSKASWIEARDARGATLVSRTVLPGESVSLDGRLPIRMTIGNAAATQLDFRGEAVDLKPSTRDNIARVELQ